MATRAVSAVEVIDRDLRESCVYMLSLSERKAVPWMSWIQPERAVRGSAGAVTQAVETQWMMNDGNGARVCEPDLRGKGRLENVGSRHYTTGFVKIPGNVK